MKHRGLLVMVGALTACASMESGIPTGADLGNAVNGRFQGGPVDAVFTRYGTPESDFIGNGNGRGLE